MQVTIKLYASLSDYLPNDTRREHSVSLEFSDSATVSQVVDRMRLPDELVHLVLLNGVYVEPEARDETRLSDGDSVAVWPPIAGGWALQSRLIVTREMGISLGDFFRIFPAVIRGRPFKHVSDGVLYENAGQRLRVQLSAENQRRLGMLRIPVTTVRLQFDGYSPKDVDEFMGRFERHFHRGGGWKESRRRNRVANRNSQQTSRQ